MDTYADIDAYYASLPPEQAEHIRALVEWVATQYPQLELVIAWNQPMFKIGGKYLIGFMPTKKHTNLLTVSDTAITTMSADLASYKHGTRSVSMPFSGTVDTVLIERAVSLRAEELGLTL